MTNFHLLNSAYSEGFSDISVSSEEMNLGWKGAWQLPLTKCGYSTKLKQQSLPHSDPEQATTIAEMPADLHKYADGSSNNLKQVIST